LAPVDSTYLLAYFGFDTMAGKPPRSESVDLVSRKEVAWNPLVYIS